MEALMWAARTRRLFVTSPTRTPGAAGMRGASMQGERFGSGGFGVPSLVDGPAQHDSLPGLIEDPDDRQQQEEQ